MRAAQAQKLNSAGIYTKETAVWGILQLVYMEKYGCVDIEQISSEAIDCLPLEAACMACPQVKNRLWDHSADRPCSSRFKEAIQTAEVKGLINTFASACADFNRMMRIEMMTEYGKLSDTDKDESERLTYCVQNVQL